VCAYFSGNREIEREREREEEEEDTVKDDRQKEWKEQPLILSLIDSYDCPHTHRHSQHQYA
jgi:hypothetical protein